MRRTFMSRTTGTTYAARAFVCGLLVGAAAATLLATMDRERFLRRLRSKAKASRAAVAEGARAAMDSAHEAAEEMAGRIQKQASTQGAQVAEAARKAMSA